MKLSRHLEIRPPVSGRTCYPACHPERSEGSRSPVAEILRCAQDDRPYLQMSSIAVRQLCLPQCIELISRRMQFQLGGDHVFHSSSIAGVHTGVNRKNV